ncbi:MAG: lipoyl(octanoyl) transferase LipB, partial [Cyanobacteria bacterium REEB65]|nr:lipoyl(octanoyl) transferase LipB [Cyanobacteria bacterium REEB65]
MPYAPAHERMLQRVEARAAGQIPDTLLVLRHEPVVTIGRKQGALQNVLAASGLPVVEAERGGDVTYHGPGQLVFYPIFAMAGPERDLHRFLRRLEESVIATLAAFDIAGHRSTGQTGVWVGDRKIASMGIAVRRWVSYHGAALNLEGDGGFGAIRPCGLDSTVMTSMAEVLRASVPRDLVSETWQAEVARVFERERQASR